MSKLLSACLFVMLLLPSQALAAKALTAVYSDSGDNFISIAAKDAKTFRIDFLQDGEPSGAYFLILKDGRWFVDASDEDAEAVDMVALYKEMGVTPEDLQDNSLTITKTDRKETVLAIKGLVWEIKDPFFGGTSDIILTTNKDVVLVTKGLLQFADDFAVPTLFGGNSQASAIRSINVTEKKEYGLLKGDGVELTLLKKVDYPKDYFQLPKNVKMVHR